MKTLKNILLLLLLAVPLASYSQSTNPKKPSQPGTSFKKTYRKTTTSSGGQIDTIRKENAPVVEDNGTVNTTGIVDGSKSSTGRPGSDSIITYSVKKRKRTITTGGVAVPDSTKTKKKQPRVN